MPIFILGSIGRLVSKGWQFIVSSVNDDLGNDVADASVISEGLGINYEDVREYQEVAKLAVGGWKRLNELPDFYRVTPTYSVLTPFDYRKSKIMQMKVHAYDKNTQEYVDQWITIESDQIHTKQEWFELAKSATNDTPFGTDLVLEYATEFQYYEKA